MSNNISSKVRFWHVHIQNYVLNLKCKCAHYYHPDSVLAEVSGNIPIDFRGMVVQLQQSQISAQMIKELE